MPRPPTFRQQLENLHRESLARTTTANEAGIRTHREQFFRRLSDYAPAAQARRLADLRAHLTRIEYHLNEFDRPIPEKIANPQPEVPPLKIQMDRALRIARHLSTELRRFEKKHPDDESLRLAHRALLRRVSESRIEPKREKPGRRFHALDRLLHAATHAHAALVELAVGEKKWDEFLARSEYDRIVIDDIEEKAEADD